MKKVNYNNNVFETSIEVMEKYFPEEFENVDWNAVSTWRNLSMRFILKYSDKLNWNVLCCINHFSFEQLAEIIDRVPYKVLFNSHGEIFPKNEVERQRLINKLLELNKECKFKRNYTKLNTEGVVDKVYKSYSNDISNRTNCRINKYGISDDQLLELTDRKTRHYYNVDYKVDYEYSCVLSDRIEYVYQAL